MPSSRVEGGGGAKATEYEYYFTALNMFVYDYKLKCESKEHVRV